MKAIKTVQWPLRRDRRAHEDSFLHMVAIRQAGGVTRWHTQPHMPPQTDAAHQWFCFMLARQLFPGDPDLWIACALHDTGELGPGDVPSPAKGMSVKMSEGTDEVEYEVRCLLGTQVQLTGKQAMQLKFVDRLDLAWVCMEEHLHGNRFARGIFHGVAPSLAEVLDTTDYIPALGRVYFDTIKETIDDRI